MDIELVAGLKEREIEMLVNPGANGGAVQSSLQLEEIVLKDNVRVKWGGCTRSIPQRWRTWGEIRSRVVPIEKSPEPNDLLVGTVLQFGKHEHLELAEGRKSVLHIGDVIVGAFGFRYAVEQYEGVVPGIQPTYEMLSQAGVMGRVVSSAHGMMEPTVVRPLGYLAGDRYQIMNTRRFALQQVPVTRHVPTIVVVGSGMDSGKTTTACGLIRGLTVAGKRVHATKLTGTSCINDLYRMVDAGADQILDFTDLGFASTAMASESDLLELARTIPSRLSAGDPDYLVMEIADGIEQRETRMLLSILHAEERCDHVFLSVTVPLAAPACLELLRKGWDANVVGLSGLATRSPLGQRELEACTSLPCLSLSQLEMPSVLSLFEQCAPRAPLSLAG